MLNAIMQKPLPMSGSTVNQELNQDPSYSAAGRIIDAEISVDMRITEIIDLASYNWNTINRTRVNIRKIGFSKEKNNITYIKIIQ